MPTRKTGPGAGAMQGLPSDRLDDESGAVVHRRTRRLTVATAVAAHLIGTGVVVLLLVFVLPVPREFEGWTPGSVRVGARDRRPSDRGCRDRGGLPGPTGLGASRRCYRAVPRRHRARGWARRHGAFRAVDFRSAPHSASRARRRGVREPRAAGRGRRWERGRVPPGRVQPHGVWPA